MPVDSRRLGVPTAGIIEKFGAEEGATVTAGTILVQLNADIERREVERAEVTLEATKIQALSDKVKFDRARSLWVDQKVGSEMEFQEAELAHRMSENRVRLASAELAVAKARLQNRMIKAPVDGVIFRRTRKEGETVQQFESIIDLIDASKLQFEVYGGPDLIGKFKPGQQVPVRLEDGPGRGTTVMGTVSYVDPAMDPVSGTFRIKIRFEPSEKVQSGFGVTLQIPSESNSP